MNLTALDAAVRNKGFSFSQTAADPTNPILIELNDTYRKVCGNQRWPFLEKSASPGNTAAGISIYPLTSLADFRQIDAVRLTGSDGTNYELENMDPQQFKTETFEQNSLPLPTGTPCLWTQYAGAIQLWPCPDGVYTVIIDYIFTPPDLANVSDVPVLPATYHDVLVWGAVLALAYRERNIWAQELAMGYYSERYKAMQEEYNLMQRQTASRVRKTGFYA